MLLGRDLLRWAWSETWWTWERPNHVPPTIQDVLCHGFNLLEASAWFVFAGLILTRWARYRRSPVELAYAGAFILFGISDLVESQWLTSWLLWWKLINLYALYRLRQWVLKRHYPDQRLY